MTEAGPLRDYSRSRAVLIGVSKYDHLPSVEPAAANSLERMRGLLRDPLLCGWPKQRVKVLREPRRRGRLPDELMKAFDGILDVALFYFVGHGQLYEDELCLALGESPETGPRCTTVGVPFSDVRAALRACDAQTKIVILDCCFSGITTWPEHSLSSTSADAAKIIDVTRGTGAFTMAASGAYRQASYEPAGSTPKPQTYFTKYLVDAVEQGIPGYPDGLPLGPIYEQASTALARDQLPEPTRTVRHDAAGFILARNRAEPVVPPVVRPASPSPRPHGGREPAPPSPRRRPRRRTISRRTIIGTLGALATASGTSLLALRLTDDDNKPHLWFSLNSIGVHAVAFSPDGKTLAVGSDDAAVQVWDVTTRTIAASLPGHDENRGVTSVAFSPDGKAIASGSYDGRVLLWDVPARTSTAKLGRETDMVTSVAFGPDGKTLAAGIISHLRGDNVAIRLWDIATRKNIATLTGPEYGVESVAFNPDGKTLASGNGSDTVQLWDIATRKSIATLTGPNLYNSVSVAFSPDGKTLASSHYDGIVRLWDVASQRILGTLTGHTGSVTSIAFSPDGKTLASGSSLGTGSGTATETLRLWDVASRRSIATLTGHTSSVTSIAFSPDGKTLASGDGSYDGGSLRLWKLS
ncbi:caspase family protein [Streptomyces sp. NPDC056661]|uniref:caspase, EACC1-associated type n=1 Tax=Streptomyces sp. NPDC056661 TaxID=3345898 RepID=UPI0036B36D73